MYVCNMLPVLTDSQAHKTLCNFSCVCSNRWREAIRNPYPLKSAFNWFPPTVAFRLSLAVTRSWKNPFSQ